MFKNIVVLIKDEHISEDVLKLAASTADHSESYLTMLRLINSPSSLSMVDPVEWQFTLKEITLKLEHYAALLQKDGLEIKYHLLQNPDPDSILQFLGQNYFDLIVTTRENNIIDGVSDTAIRDTGIPVMVVPEGTISPIRRIMVPLDGSQRAECALTIAEKMAQVEDRELLIVHVVPQPELLQQSNQNLELVNLANQMTFHGNKEGSNYLKQLSSRIRCKTETYLATHRNVTAALHEICQEKAVDLVIMSAHGYAGDPRWSYGSTTGNFLIYGNLPILVVQDIQSTRIPAVHPASQPRTSYASAS